MNTTYIDKKEMGVLDFMTDFVSSVRYRVLEDLQRTSVNLHLIYCGWEQCNPKHRFGPNLRQSFVLHIVRKGKGVLELKNKTYHLSEGDAFILYPDTEAYYEADQDDPWLYMWVGFTGINAEECVSQSGFSRHLPVRKLSCLGKVYAYIEKMIQAHRLTYANELKRNAFLILFFSELIDDYSKSLLSGVMPRSYSGLIYVKYAMEYMALHYRKKVRIAELADYIGVNRSYLTSSFKKNIGCSPQTYLLHLRLDKARALLLETDKAIRDIACEVGYPDQLSFSKMFKQRFGVSPKHFRDATKENLGMMEPESIS